ncbi:FAD/NAD(P)-binding domain-containing protein [Cucurbitaria berberidis CBS 394.84]|uniref:FAD/NAD(P)-binding domain-containing protein n=1 Tax=Cucurbitaria berberidis CBS 394.84 TaxID=1168544 RepID=A0A9P4LEH3_9PLEO|nr:FAD/NAD(P)-binding domain-containing protein [Cucurbitaria berberidis CBS 394.84]KAF1851377.1 FAD/NAD(P)-binding domain-containing protein [Cucurbitaria berberidis CBS 394.84]
MTERTTVAVVGLGPAGLVALKNLTEEGFDVIAFDRNSYVGGLWQYTNKDQTSVMDSTIVNISKERGCFTDFPYPEGISSYPTAAQVHQYLVSFLKHFNLEPRIRLNTPIHQITFNEEHQKWVLDVEGKSKQYFDKVVIAIGGMVGVPNIPTIEGIEKFRGPSIHSQAFKQPAEFRNRRVMVVGFGNSAADTSTQLAGIADKVYLAHRHGARILPRGFNGAPIDHTHSMRLFTLQCLVAKYFPRFGEKFFDKFVKALQDKSFKLRPEWGFEPAGRLPIVSDDLVPCLENGSITSVAGVKHVLGGSQVELEDGRTLEVDAIIWCTGYKSSFSVLDPQYDPSSRSPPLSWSTASGSNNRALFRLYHNVFSLEKPDSLAFLGNVHFALGGFQIFDMASQAIAQIWAGNSMLPSKAQMEIAVDKHHEWLASHAQDGHNISPGTVEAGPWIRAMDDLAGTGVNEYLGYGLKGWMFWLKDRPFCNLLMGGLWSPHIHRVFEGKRKAWTGAKEAIERVNEVLATNRRRAKEKTV